MGLWNYINTILSKVYIDLFNQNLIHATQTKIKIRMSKESNATLKGRSASLENLLFGVEQIQLDDNREILTDYQFSSQYSSAIYCPSMNKVLHMAGSKYQLVTNEQLIMPIHDKLNSILGSTGFRVQCTNEDDRRFSAQFILTDKVIQVADKDALNAMIEVQNSYDGSLQHSIALSFYRQVCTNGMMAWKKDTQIAQRHDKDFLFNLDAILTRLDALDVQLQEFRKLTERQVTSKEIEQIMDKLKEFKNHDAFPKKIIQEVPLKVYQEAEELSTTPNAWLLYNGFNYFLNHDQRIGLGMDSKERIDRNVLKVIQKELALN